MWMKLAKNVISFPYHSTSRDRAYKIIQEGFDGSWFGDHFQEHFYEFYEDLSDESKRKFEENYEKFLYSSTDFEGKEFEAATERLAELWFEEHPNANLLWATDYPNTEFLDMDPGIVEFQESPDFRDLLSDSYGSGWIYEKEPGNIPGSLFRKLDISEIPE